MDVADGGDDCLLEQVLDRRGQVGVALGQLCARLARRATQELVQLSAAGGRLAVIGDGDFLANGYISEASARNQYGRTP